MFHRFALHVLFTSALVVLIAAPAARAGKFKWHGGGDNNRWRNEDNWKQVVEPGMTIDRELSSSGDAGDLTLDDAGDTGLGGNDARRNAENVPNLNVDDVVFPRQAEVHLHNDNPNPDIGRTFTLKDDVTFRSFNDTLTFDDAGQLKGSGKLSFTWGKHGAEVKISASQREFAGGFELYHTCRRYSTRHAQLHAAAAGALGTGVTTVKGDSRVVYQPGAQAPGGARDGGPAGVRAVRGGVIELRGAYEDSRDRFVLGSRGNLVATAAQLDSIQRVAAFTKYDKQTGAQAKIAAGAMISPREDTPGAAVANAGTDADLLYGLVTDIKDADWTLTVGAGTPWTGLGRGSCAASGADRRLQTGTVKIDDGGGAFGEIILFNDNGANPDKDFVIGNGEDSPAFAAVGGGPVSARIVTPGRRGEVRLESSDPDFAGGISRFIVGGDGRRGRLVISAANALDGVPVEVAEGGMLRVTAPKGIGGDVTVKSGGTFVADRPLSGSGTIRVESGGYVWLKSDDALAGSQVPQREEGAAVLWGNNVSDPEGLPDDAVANRATPRAMEAMKECADGRKGYVVWESRRPSGTETLKYRIWKRNLDGSGLQMISGQPRRGGYSHIAPRISPDGRYVVFAGKAWNGYKDERVREIYGGEYAPAPFDAWIVEMDPETLEPLRVRELTQLRGRVGGAGEDHIFEWKDNETLYVVLQKQSAVYEVNVRTGEIGRKMVSIEGEKTVGPGGEYVLCAQGSGAGYGKIVNDKQGPPRVKDFKKLGGCQANISVDNDFVLWEHTPGQISILNIETGKQHKLSGIKAALPDSHDYIYFPALVRDMSYLVFAGGDRHSHAHADYEIFLVPWDKEATKRTGPPVRYTFNHRDLYKDADKKTGHVMDRWPHAWVYNPRFARPTERDQFEAAGPLENLEPDLLAEEFAKRREGSSLQGVYKALKGYRGNADNPEKAKEAERLLKHLDKWADWSLDRAREAENGSPGKAVELYSNVREWYQGLKPGKTARKRIAELVDKDKDFAEELQAWSRFEKLRKVAGDFRVPHGADPSCEDPAFASKNEEAIKRFKSILSALQKDCPNTRAMLRARSLARQYEVPASAVEADKEQVTATVVATVTQVSTPLKVEDVEPYTEALICTEYKVKKVLDGELKKNRIVTVQLAMSDGEQLAPSTFEPGEAYRLKLGDWEDQPHYHSHPIAQDIIGVDNMDAKWYFIYEAKPVEGQ